jgi:hypothetical protein
MDFINLLQWPGMVASVTAAYLVASQSKRRRQHGFWWFIASNVLWIVWGWHDGAWALIVLQVALAILNIRGLRKNDPETARANPEKS